MKKTLLNIVLMSSLLLAACQGEASESTADTSSENTESSEQVDSTESSSEENSSAEAESQAREEIEPQYYIDPNVFSVQSIDPNSEEKLVLLTFDDAPYGNTLKIADALEAHDAYGLFFVNGMYLDEEGSQIIKELHDRGHVIANHTETHQTLPEANEELQREEILTTNEKIEEITGEPVRFFRAPHGMMTDYSEALVAEEDMQWVNWSFGYDWMEPYQNPATLAQVTLHGSESDPKLLGPGSNILMHDRTWTADALPDILDGLYEQEFTVVDPKAISHHPEDYIESVENENE